MRSVVLLRFAVPLVALALSVAPAPASAATPAAAVAVFAGGCFWGVEGVFEHVSGVREAVAGYAGGNAATAHYELVGTGTTGHAESVRVVYDPARVSYRELLEIFFTVVHDPTEKDRQGPDEGPQYRSAIFTTTAEQRREALAAIAALDRAHVFRSKVVTEVQPLRGFYPAEAYHQHFMALHPNYPYIVVNDAPKLAALRAKYPKLARV